MKKNASLLTVAIVIMILINLAISTQVTNSHNGISLHRLESKADGNSTEIIDPEDDPIPNGLNPIESFISTVIDFLF